MGAKDLIISPIYLILLTGIAYFIRPLVTTPETRKYFLPGLWVRFAGAIAVGFVYQFYYGDGDTFTYFHRGSRYIWDSFLESPILALSIIFGEMNYTGESFQYVSHIYTYGDSASFAIVRIAGFFDILTLHTYSATAILFACISFSGVWLIYKVFYDHYPRFHKELAIAILFFPSVFFWGSGLLKDTITLAALGWLFYGAYHLFKLKGSVPINIFLFALGAYALYVIKIYILLCFLPALAFWGFFQYQERIKNGMIKILVAPILLALGGMAAYAAIIYLGEDHYRYSLDEVLYTAEQTAKWNYYVSERGGGAGYTLGDYDFSVQGLARKFAPAVITSFFRPYIYEVRNPVMLLSALENTFILGLFLYSFRRYANWRLIFSKPIIMLSIVFSILFGFAIGVTTYNFGSLVRYKIPMLPFLAASLFLITRPDLKFENDHHTKV